MKRILTLAALTLLTACDLADRRDVRNEQVSRRYRSAMEDYRAGRLDAALTGFEKEIAENPANGSARFQLACLLQDVKHQYLDAICDYREYLRQHPSSDKAKLARDRISVCEKELAKELASRYGLNSREDAAKEIEDLCKKLKLAESKIVASERNLSLALGRVRSLSDERERLMNSLKGEETDEVVETRPNSVEVKDLLEESDEVVETRPDQAEVKDLTKESDDAVREQSALLPVAPQTTEPVVKKEPSHENEDHEKKNLPERPKTYVVQEGDTLYRIAKRYYGSISAWKTIREANKALISSDNRLRAGDTLTLP